jgi:hypothetical protein
VVAGKDAKFPVDELFEAGSIEFPVWRNDGCHNRHPLIAACASVRGWLP